MPARAVALSLTSTKRTRPEALELAGDVEQPAARAAERRVELNRDDELAFAECSREPRLALLLAEGDGDLARVVVEPGAGLALRVDRRPDRRDLGRCRAAAAADHARAEVARVGGELGEVVGRRVRVDHPAAEEAREPDVRERGERRARAGLHLLERRERREQAGAVVRAERGEPERRRGAPPPGVRVTPASVSAASSKVSSATIGSDETAADGLDRVDELLEVVERLEHEEVGAALLEHRRLLGEELASPRRARRLAERPDRAADEDVAPGQLARLAGELHRRSS